jgi:hypothetical protein
VKYDVATAFAVLCSNCHRMIHRTLDPSDIGALQKLIQQERGRLNTHGSSSGERGGPAGGELSSRPHGRRRIRGLQTNAGARGLEQV